MPARNNNNRLSFGLFALDRTQGVLLRNGQRVPLGKRSYRLLEVLASRSGEVITKAELMDAGWPGVVVEESNLSVQIALLRKIIGSAPDGTDWIATAPRIGYCFTGAKTGNRPNLVRETAWALAVLPFTCLTNDDQAELFGDGLADELITALSKVGGIPVIARSSSFAYKGIAADVRQVASKLGARYIVDGSVKKEGDQIRVTAQLVDGSTGNHSWAERYDRTFSGFFSVQDDIVRRIVSELTAVLVPTEVDLWPSIPTRGTSNVEAYRCFLRGRALQRSPTRTSAIHAHYCDLFHRAIAIDPNYPAPYAALAMGATLAYYYKWVDDPQASLQEAYALVDSAIERDPGDAYIRAVAALVAMYASDLDRWAYEVGEALSLDPNFAPALSLRAPLKICSGQPEEAIKDLLRAIQLDPHFTHNYLYDLGVAYLVAGHYEAAAKAFEERILLVPDTDIGRAYLAAALGSLGRIEEARANWAKVMLLNPAFRFEDRISSLPFRRKEDLERVAYGLQRAGLPPPAFLMNRSAIRRI